LNTLNIRRTTGYNLTVQNYYDILGVEEHATTDQIKLAYRTRVKQCHPDLYPSDQAALTAMQQLNEAYAVLSDPNRRAGYRHSTAPTFTPPRRTWNPEWRAPKRRPAPPPDTPPLTKSWAEMSPAERSWAVLFALWWRVQLFLYLMLRFVVLILFCLLPVALTLAIALFIIEEKWK